MMKSESMAKLLRCLVCWLLLLLLLQNIQRGRGSSNSDTVTKLRVGVPKKYGFTQFVNVDWNPHQQKFNVSGYSIDVFNAAVKLLPFRVSPEFLPFAIEKGQSGGIYDLLVIQQIPEKYDVLVGDFAILASRTKIVDFSLPYKESGVSMLVKVQSGRHQTMWTFVKPFSWDLWLSIVIMSAFIGLATVVMERNVNSVAEDGSQTHLNVVAMLWFPLSQAVLPQRELVAKKCSRFVLMVWLLLAFVLMQSYTASLTTMLTVDQLKPSFPTVKDLIEGGYYVGYQTDSFVRDMLVQRLNFNPSKLRAYSDVSDYHHALRKGSDGGGVAAIFDEIPFLKLFLAKYGSNYVMAGLTYRTDGLGFAFPLNSNLTSHFSRAILNVIESDTIDDIEKKYFGDQSGRNQDQATQTSSTTPMSLTFYSFAGLYLVAGIATLLALIVSESVIWQKPILMARAYSERYLVGTSSSRDSYTHDPMPDSITMTNVVASTSIEGAQG